MPLPQLASRALYRVSTLPDVLTALGAPNSASGYAEIQNAVERQTQRSVNNRSVQLMMYQGQYLKYSKCLAIQSNILAFASREKITNIPTEMIDEHEYYIPRLQNIVAQVAAHKKIKINDLRDKLGEECSYSGEFIDAMMKYRRCLREEARTVREALVGIAPDVLVSGKARDGKVGVAIDRELVDKREALPIPWSIRRIHANDE